MDIVKFESWRKAKSSGDHQNEKKLLSDLVSSNLALGRRMSVRYAKQGADESDLMQAAAEGLIQCFNRYDPKVAPFSTYALFWIKNEMQKATAKSNPSYRRSLGLPPEALQKEAALTAKHGEEPTAEDIGVSDERLRRYKEDKIWFSSYEQDGPSNGHDWGAPSETERNCFEGVLASSADTESEAVRIETWHRLANAMTILTDEERQVIVGLWLEELPRKVIAKELDMTVKQVTAIEEEALDVLKHEMVED